MSHDISEQSAREQLEWIAKRFPVSEQAQYLKLGKWFSREPLSALERESLGIMLRGIHAFRPGECYMNAGKIALEREAMTFCEGYAAGLWPVPHAWISWRGRAIDVTWPVAWKQRFVYKKAISVEAIMQRVEHNIKNCAYLGVDIPTGIIRDHFISCRSWSPMFDARFHMRWPEYESVLKAGNKSATLLVPGE